MIHMKYVRNILIWIALIAYWIFMAYAYLSGYEFAGLLAIICLACLCALGLGYTVMSKEDYDD